MVLNKSDEEMIVPKIFFKYMKIKYPRVNPKAMKRIVMDWFDGKCESDYHMSQNIPLYLDIK